MISKSSINLGIPNEIWALAADLHTLFVRMPSFRYGAGALNFEILRELDIISILAGLPGVARAFTTLKLLCMPTPTPTPSPGAPPKLLTPPRPVPGPP